MTLLPRHWLESEELTRLWPGLRSAQRGVLMLDYDGTLAPFKTNRLEAYPYPGVEERLMQLASLPKVRLVLVTGRAARELEGLLGSCIGAKFEIWGNHGWERLEADGSYRFFPLDTFENQALDEVKRCMAQLGFPQVIETKPASIAIHWRSLRPAQQDQIRATVKSIHSLYAGESNLQLLPFDGGLELRSKDRTKGTVVNEILAEEETALSGICPPCAYLGDDMTDEDAFAAIGRRGLAMLVRSEPRESSAPVWLAPPEELLQFLDNWIQAAKTDGTTSGDLHPFERNKPSIDREDTR